MPDTKVCPQCGRTYPTADRFCTVDGAALLSSGNADSLIGAVLAERYLVQEKLGEGGMGEVYLAEHVRMKRKVAVKLMRSWMLGDPVAVSRFHREAENASQITHPNVAQVYDFGETADGMIYLAMEFVPGEPLSSILDREGRLHAVRAAEIVRQTAEALAAAHHMGILHRDLKPDNVMISKTRSGTDIVKLVDFGIARAMSRGTQQFTSTGMIVGTPDYMSPEQLAGDTLDERSDLYALALIAFRAITGHGAFPEGATGEALIARLTNNSRRLSAVFPSIQRPDTLQAAFDRALASDPEQRYADALEFANELDAAASEIPLTDEAQAYLTALSQRMSTPARLGVVPESATPTVPVRASTAVRTPSGEMPRVSRDGLASPPRVPTPPVSRSSVSAPTPTSPTRISSRPAADERPGNDSPAAPLGVVSRADTPIEPAGAARPSRSRRPVLLAIVAIAAVTLAFAATKLRPVRETGQTVALPPTAPRADSSAATDSVRSTDSSTAVVPAIAAAADSVRIARAVRQGVFAVASSAGRGTAFLVEAGGGRGIALTSASALPRDRSESIEVFLEPDRKVRGTLLTVDSASGVAALLVSLQSCSRCKALDVLPADSALQPVEGDSVVANSIGGRAGHRPVRMALGRIGPKSVASSVRVTSSNAGAPVLSTKSGNVTVVAIAAMNSGRGGSSAAFVPASVLRETFARAKSEQAAKALQPDDSLFWTWPVRGVDAGAIETARRRTADDLPRYKIAADGFALLAMTPQVMAWRASQYGAAVGEANPFDIRITDPIDKWPAWNAYRNERRAVVVFHATPEKAALPEFPKGVVDFKRGDFVSMQLLRDGQELLPIESARIPAVGNVKEYTDRKRDVYNAGILVYHPFDFAPKANGGWASYEAVITDARRRDKPTRIAIPIGMLQAIAADLGDWQKR